jgi:hypothetical protein
MFGTDDLWERIQKLEDALEVMDDRRFKMKTYINELEGALSYHAGTTVKHALEMYQEHVDFEDEAQMEVDSR